VKVITLTEYWASLMANGFKRIETRSWPTRYRGPLLIHAAKGFPRACRTLITREPFLSKLAECTPPIFNSMEVPLSRVLCRVELVDCVSTTWLLEADCGAARAYRGDLGISSVASGGDRQFELEFGDYSDGRWAWITRSVKRASTPFLCRGALGLWELPDDEISLKAPELLS
jgi:hypothetical protein